MKNYKAYDGDFIKNYIENNKNKIDYVECGILGYWDDTSEVIYENEIFKEHFLEPFNKLVVGGLDGSFKGEPHMKLYLKNNTEEVLPSYKEPRVVDVTDKLSELIVLLKNEMEYDIVLQADNDVRSQLEMILKGLIGKK